MTASAHSYYELAAFLPTDLNLVSREQSRCARLLTMGADRVVRMTECDPADHVLYLDASSTLAGSLAERAGKLIDLNQDALFLAQMAVDYDDFSIAAVPFFGASRITSQLSSVISSVTELLDLLALSARLRISEQRYDAAANTVVQLYRLGGMIASGGADMDWYACGTRGTRTAIGLIRVMLNNDVDVMVIDQLREALQRHDNYVQGYLRATLSDLFRDVVVMIADLGALAPVLPSIAGLFRNEFITQWWPKCKENIATGEESMDLARLNRKKDTIATVLSNANNVFVVSDTLKALSRGYQSCHEAFKGNLRARLSLCDEKDDRKRLWSEEFQLTSNYPGPFGDGLVSDMARYAASVDNSLGRLFLVDIERMANAQLDRLMIVPWRGSVEVAATEAQLGIRAFQHRKDRCPRSLREVVDEGLLASEPVDLLMHIPLELIPDKAVIIGTSLERVRTVMSYPRDAPELRWTVPAFTRRSHE